MLISSEFARAHTHTHTHTHTHPNPQPAGPHTDHGSTSSLLLSHSLHDHTFFTLQSSTLEKKSNANQQQISCFVTNSVQLHWPPLSFDLYEVRQLQSGPSRLCLRLAQLCWALSWDFLEFDWPPCTWIRFSTVKSRVLRCECRWGRALCVSAVHRCVTEREQILPGVFFANTETSQYTAQH